MHIFRALDFRYLDLKSTASTFSMEIVIFEHSNVNTDTTVSPLSVDKDLHYLFLDLLIRYEIVYGVEFAFPRRIENRSIVYRFHRREFNDRELWTAVF